MHQGAMEQREGAVLTEVTAFTRSLVVATRISAPLPDRFPLREKPRKGP